MSVSKQPAMYSSLVESANSLHSNAVWQVHGDERSNGKTADPTALITLGKYPKSPKPHQKTFLLFRREGIRTTACGKTILISEANAT